MDFLWKEWGTFGWEVYKGVAAQWTWKIKLLRDRAECIWLILTYIGRAASNIRRCDCIFMLCKHWKGMRSGVVKIGCNDWSRHFQHRDFVVPRCHSNTVTLVPGYTVLLQWRSSFGSEPGYVGDFWMCLVMCSNMWGDSLQEYCLLHYMCSAPASHSC